MPLLFRVCDDSRAVPNVGNAFHGVPRQIRRPAPVCVFSEIGRLAVTPVALQILRQRIDEADTGPQYRTQLYIDVATTWRQRKRNGQAASL